MPIPYSMRPAFKGRRREIKLAVNAMKSVPCADCGGTFHPCAMDFDHRVSVDKSHDIGAMVSGGAALETIIREASKCDVVCANCHRVRTWARGRVKRESAAADAPQQGLFPLR
jgi:hypothetical protein